MTWIFGTVVFLLVGAIAFIVGRSAEGTTVTTDEEGLRHISGGTVKVVGYTITGLMALAWLILTLVSSIKIIDAGHVGVVKTFGEITGQVGDGPTFVAPWSDVIEVSTRAQRKQFVRLAAFSKETQDVFVDATLNLSVAARDVQCLYRTVGPDWYEKLVPPRVLQTLKDETVKYNTVEVAPNRERIRRNVAGRLQEQLSQFRLTKGSCVASIDVQDFLLENVDFRPEFKEAIERKQIATQDAQTARNRVQQAKFEAQQKIETAKGDAQATLVRAQKQARANRLLNNSLTSQLVAYEYVQKLAPNVTVLGLPIGPNGTPQFILPGSIFEGAGR